MRRGNHTVRIFLSLLLVIMLSACGQNIQSNQTTSITDTNPASDSKKLTVYTSFYPLYYVATRIGGEHTEVKNVVPAGTEPHDFEPTAKDVVDMSQANIFVYNGSGFEAWIEKALEGFDQSKMVIVNATDGLNLLTATEGEHEHAGEAAAGTTTTEPEHKEHGEFDPHVWLDPTMLKAQAEKVKDALTKADQAHSDDFKKNYEKLAEDLDSLDKEFKEMVATAKQKELMVAHSAFTYLAYKYGLEQVAISGITPADEPTPSELKELVEYVKEHHIKYIMFETLASPKVAEVIARETGAKTAVLNPLEGLTVEEEKAGKDYLSIMRENLETLRIAIQ